MDHGFGGLVRVRRLPGRLERGSDISGRQAGQLAIRTVGTGAGPKLSIESSDFQNGGPMPDKLSAYHDGQAPSLSWRSVPEKAVTLALVIEDPDAPSDRPFVHWLVANIPAGAKGMPADLAANLPPDLTGAVQGASGHGDAGYYGPRPPAGSGPHHYHFQLFAVDQKLELKNGFSYDDLIGALKGHVLGDGELIGTYEQK